MADTLSQKLDELEPNLRTPNLLNLVSSLTVSELRVLRSKLLEMHFQTDIIARLPIELQLCVADHVSSGDVFSYTNVSRTWRHIWLQDKLMNHIVDKWYPGLFQLDEMGDNLEAYERRKAVFLQILQRDSRRSKGRFRSIFFHGFRLEDDTYFKLDENFHSSNGYNDILVTTPSDRGLGGVISFYRDGKLAWSPSTRPPPDNGVIILDDFRTMTRKMYKVQGTLMQALSISLRALGNKLVVGIDSRVAHVWHIETNEYQAVALPSRIYTCKSEGEYVSFVTDDGAVFIWKSHGRVLEVDMTKPRAIFASLAQPHKFPLYSNYPESSRAIILTRAHLDVILHPSEPEVYFVVTMNPMSGALVGFVAVHEYFKNKYSRTYKVQLPMHQTASQSQPFLGVFSLLDCYRIDSHGSFMLASLTETTANKVPLSLSVTFNTIKRKFSILSQIIPLKSEHASNRRDLRRGVRSHCWRTQTTFSLSNMWDLGYRLPLITLSPPAQNLRGLYRLPGGVLHLKSANVDYGLDPVRGRRISFQHMHLIPAIMQRQPLFPIGDRTALRGPRGAENGYMIDEAEAEELTQPGTCRGICGDDDFLIFVGEDNYTVWSFDTDIFQDLEITAP